MVLLSGKRRRQTAFCPPTEKSDTLIIAYFAPVAPFTVEPGRDVPGEAPVVRVSHSAFVGNLQPSWPL